MNRNPYDILGVAPDAPQEEIRKAYRRLARKLHPDLNPSDRGAAERFKDLSAAYDLLGDPEKRARFDKGEIDASGAERPPRQAHGFAGATAAGEPHFRWGTDAFDEVMDADDLLGSLFGLGGESGRATGRRMRGGDLHGQMALGFLEAVNGTTKRVTLPDGSALDVAVPPGTRDGQVLRLRGKGAAGLGGGPPGDLLIAVSVGGHRHFSRQGDDIHLELPVSLREAVLGARIEVPMPSGPVAVSVPKGSNSGTVLRLKGRGVQRPDGSRGDAYLMLRLVLPDRPDAELEAFATRWAAGKAHNPRAEMEN